MITLILLVLVGILAALFAGQNTTSVSVTLANHTLKGIPLYLIVLGSLLMGLLISSVISLFNSIASSWTIRGKNKKIVESKRTVSELSKHVRQLELENDKLKTELDRKINEKPLRVSPERQRNEE